MSIEVSYSEARNNLASLLDRVTDEVEVAVIKRRGHEDVALIGAAELSSILETEHLFRSPANAKRIMDALPSVADGKGERITVDELREEFGVPRKTKSKKKN